MNKKNGNDNPEPQIIKGIPPDNVDTQRLSLKPSAFWPGSPLDSKPSPQAQPSLSDSGNTGQGNTDSAPASDSQSEGSKNQDS